jgi:hypothetical protein
MQRAKEKQKADILGPVACTWAYKLKKRTDCTVNVAESKSKANWKEPKWVKEKHTKFELTRETLYGGQGKNRPLIINQNERSDIQNKHEGQREDHTMQDIEPFYNGLSQPPLNHTDEVILGHNKMKMRK